MGLGPVIRVAAVQMDIVQGAVERNLSRVLSFLQEAAQNGADVAVFPECALSGYCFDSLEEALPHALPINHDGPVGRFGVACRALGVIGVLGFLERSDKDLVFNSCAVAGGSMARPHFYRKTHLPTLGVDRFATPGDRLEIAVVEGIRFGPLICYDVRFPEAARVLTLQQAQIIVLPTNWPEGAESAPEYVLRARARENGVFIVAANRVGTERGRRFIGLSQIVAPDGNVLAQAHDGEQILYADIRPTDADRKRIVIEPGAWEQDTVGDRRPELYRELAL